MTHLRIGLLGSLLLALRLGSSFAADGADSSAASESMPPMFMAGMYGPYTMSREGSGTSWQPDSTPMAGAYRMGEPWTTMWHGFANIIYDEQGGPRGAVETFSNSMLMFMGRRELPHGAFGLRLMLSADPLMGARGYPELFQSGETANGVQPLIDRQHPHNLVMEAASVYSADLNPGSAVFVYLGVAGEPALGPPAFMHRFSGIDNPVAPLSHHWLDSTHISYGVITTGYSWQDVKLETSVFNGREPDQHRYDVELSRLDSYSARISYNPLPDLSLQVSGGRLESPEQLSPDIAVRRTTASASYNRMLHRIQWQTTFAFGRNEPSLGATSDAWLLESELIVDAAHTFLARTERVAKDELFLPGQTLYGRTFNINAVSLGYIYDFTRLGPCRIGLGGLISAYRYPAALDPAYGDGPVSYLLFTRIKL